ncbi:ribonuclease HII [Ruficoccus sp. ZRK36]|uniref:ribonuclease HII n=1 Tax=Ruficoccus sp. ZRK36 TaxID=2866311 RepID=UPI001C7371FD|nr:ribonuclease HII [Ruficoccus sp. ZRK36]QYY35632.1 ribonuclease HII [Ruficoccus sp. ZRK36]
MKNNRHLWEHDCALIAAQGALAGVDEAGRGALAGPVVAAAFCPGEGFFEDSGLGELCSDITDSKLLKPAHREEILARLEGWRNEGRVAFAAAAGTVQEIDELNILGATRLAMTRALESLRRELPRAESEAMPLFEQVAPAARLHILIDGKPLKKFPYAHAALVKGDSRSLCIAAASIVAKVTRDRLMVELDAAFPAYGFAGHKGYGTPAHCEALRQYGPSPHHRALFLRKVLK